MSQNEWKRVPEDARIVKKSRFMERILLYEMFDLPEEFAEQVEWIQRGIVVIGEEKIYADIALREWVSGYGECYHDFEPYCYRRRV